MGSFPKQFNKIRLKVLRPRRKRIFEKKLCVFVCEGRGGGVGKEVEKEWKLDGNGQSLNILSINFR